MALPNSPRPARTHIFIIDGTLSRFEEGRETNAGLLYKLLRDQGPLKNQTFGYDPGVQGMGLTKWLDVAMGKGINDSILTGYATLASRYRSGDRIMLFGYSRGAYAVRSLAGFIGRVGLLAHEHATQSKTVQAFRHYETASLSYSGRKFANSFCHSNVPIEIVGIWDTVSALGLPYPLLARLAPMATAFHNHELGLTIRNGFHALAIDEDRVAYEPVVWDKADGWAGRMEQAWFAGAHADVGGNIWHNPKARSLSNIPFRWIVEHAVSCGLILPDGWLDRFPCDPAAPALGNHNGNARLFRTRMPRRIGVGFGEYVHSSVAERMRLVPGYHPIAKSLSETIAPQPALA